MREVQEELREESLVAAFRSHEEAVAAAAALEAAGVPADHIGLTADNVRQAREAAGSFSPLGAIVGALLGAAIAIVFVVAGGETMQRNLVAVALGAPALVFAFAAIGALAGRAKLFQSRRYESYERAVEKGNALVSVSGDRAELARAREVLERRGTIRIRHEETGEAL